MKVPCGICPHHCELAEGQLGRCRARRCTDGKVVCDNYGELTAMALDPIEKKPLMLFHPGSMVLSIGSYGCNLRCPWCQNHDISMADGADGNLQLMYVSPEQLAERSAALAAVGNIGVAYTYNEPLVSYEYVRDCAELIHGQGQYNVVVTNGMVCEGPLRELLPLVDAFNIDLKGFTQAFYDMAGGDLATVKRAIEVAHEDAHVEVTTLVIPGENDGLALIDAMAAWLAGIDPQIPYHLTRFIPRYRMADKPMTPTETMLAAADVARKHLSNVYLGNM